MATINGTPGNDSARFGETNLIGTVGDDDIFGLAGNDFLDGGSGGNDFLDGGEGDDNLGANSIGEHILNGGVGNDILFAAGSSGPGSVLDGGDGNDRLSAEDTDDILNGGAGDDILAGGFGSDLLIGGAGNDFYVLTPEVGIDDTIIENENDGIDTVEATTSFTLSENLENLVLKEDGVVGTGNELNNSITATSAQDNTLSGLRGNDSLSGGIGSDVLLGGSGDDLLIGGAGRDRLVGGTGADRFSFFAINEAVDTIVDFGVNDRLQASASAFGGGLKPRLVISADQFRIGSAAADASDRFIYNNSTGALFFDVDGTGRSAQVQIARLVGAPTLSAANISA